MSCNILAISYLKDYIHKLDERFGKDGNKLFKMEFKVFSSIRSDLLNEMKSTVKRDGLLKEYSPWLTAFHTNQYSQHIEIPGNFIAIETVR